MCPRRKQTFTDVKHNSLLTGESYTMIRITTVEVPISRGTIKCPRIHSLYQKYLYPCTGIVFSFALLQGLALQSKLSWGTGISAQPEAAQHIHPSPPRHLKPSLLSVKVLWRKWGWDGYSKNMFFLCRDFLCLDSVVRCLWRRDVWLLPSGTHTKAACAG